MQIVYSALTLISLTIVLRGKDTTKGRWKNKWCCVRFLILQLGPSFIHARKRFELTH